MIEKATSMSREPSPAAGGWPGSRSLLTYALAAISSCIFPELEKAPDVPENRFLLSELDVVTETQPYWAGTLLTYLQQPGVIDTAYFRLAQMLPISAFELLATALAVGVERDVMVGRALAHLQVPAGQTRPTLWLLGEALGDTVAADRHPIDALLTGTAVRSGLLQISAADRPLPERAIYVPEHICLALQGYDSRVAGAVIDGHLEESVPLPASITNKVREQAKALITDRQRTLALRTGSPAEGKAIAGQIASNLNLRPVFIDPETADFVTLTPWLLLRGLLPVFGYDLGPGERKTLAALPYYEGPKIILLGRDGTVETTAGTPLTWSIPIPTPAEREALWQQALPDAALARQLARQYRYGSGRIAQLGRLAHHAVHLTENDTPTLADIQAAAWASEGSGLEGLAQPIKIKVPDEALVVADPVRQRLERLVVRCQMREFLSEQLGITARVRYRPGVQVLLVGPSGTGKTLAASWLATRLGLPLYRVDTASINSKYIGETEKNLARLLALAEQAEIVLLFDEADSLFGKRTEVQQANDRFANAQTNYLLERIETYEGISLLTSNSLSRFDDAFSRRLDMIIEIPLPNSRERRHLWRVHLGKNHTLSKANINQLAGMVDLAGGHIRNIILSAAALATAVNRPISFDDVLIGAADEYKKLDRQLPFSLMNHT